MKTILSLSALLITLTLTAQSNTATWYLNNTSGNGIQSPTSVASGDYSTAMGYYTTASGAVSTAMGEYTNASGDNSTAMGYQTEASNNYSTAMGYETTASEAYSTAMGSYTTASGGISTAMGFGTEASGDASTAMGVFAEASGVASTAMGGASTASDYGSLVVGQYNLLGSTVTNSATEFSTDNTAFVIGNGTSPLDKSDAFKVMFNGDATVSNDLRVKGDVTVGDVNVFSDARLKANIISLGSTLAKLLQIDGKTYTMKKDENKKQKIGVLAQDIEKVFPELVSESNGVKSVNYQGLVPVLINALKEQQVEIDRLKEQEARIERLEKLLLNS